MAQMLYLIQIKDISIRYPLSFFDSLEHFLWLIGLRRSGLNKKKVVSKFILVSKICLHCYNKF